MHRTVPYMYYLKDAENTRKIITGIHKPLQIIITPIQIPKLIKRISMAKVKNTPRIEKISVYTLLHYPEICNKSCLHAKRRQKGYSASSHYSVASRLMGHTFAPSIAPWAQANLSLIMGGSSSSSMDTNP